MKVARNPTRVHDASRHAEERSVLACLADGHSQSFADLARGLGQDRMSVQASVNRLRQQGLPIQTTGDGRLRLPWPVELLDHGLVVDHLSPSCRDAGDDLQVLWRPSSTSDIVRERLRSGARRAIVLAESQSAGRGRRGRQWLAAPGMNVCLSVGLRLDSPVAGLAGLSLAAGVQVAQALAAQGCDRVGLKWPNDVMVDGAKLAGLLVEADGIRQGSCAVVLGVGLNLRLSPDMVDAFAQPVTDLYSVMEGETLSRNVMVARLLSCLLEGMDVFARHGWCHFAEEYARRDVLRGKNLVVLTPQGSWQGVGAGVDTRGALQVMRGAELLRVDSAEVSVRAT